jgi:hypothetical protein
LRELRVREAGKDLRDEEKRRDYREYRDDPQEELHAIADEQSKIPRDEREYPAR